MFHGDYISNPSITAYCKEYYFSLSGTFANQCFSGYTENGETWLDNKTLLNDIPTGGVVCKDNFKILINNNNVSGISVADFYIDNYIAHHREGESFNGVLVEEWNTIQDFAIFNNKLVYSKNGVYYCVEEGTPALFRVLDQVVCNCNYEKNSYDIKRDLILHFASDWNNAWLTNPGNTDFDFEMHAGPSEDKYYIASAVNEYNLKNNASIILNMMPCMFDLKNFGGRTWWQDTFYPSGQWNRSFTYYNAPSDFVINYLKTGGVDFYTGLISEGKAIYNSTPTTEGFINSDLIGLPYPNDANGNVQYSPSIFAKFVSTFGNDVFVKEGSNVYQLMKSDNQPVLAFYLGTLIEALDEVFILQGQYYLGNKWNGKRI